MGSGLFAGVFAYYAKKAGKTCLVLEKREHAGGNIYCENIEGINVHRYGAHIFHTSNKEVWNKPMDQQAKAEAEWIEQLNRKYPVTINWKLVKKVSKMTKK